MSPHGRIFFLLRIADKEKEGNYFYARVISLGRVTHIHHTEQSSTNRRAGWSLSSFSRQIVKMAEITVLRCVKTHFGIRHSV